MKVTCLTTQERLFETRILKRMAEPVFVPREQLPEGLQTPLLLFGQWFEGDFWAGVRWLAAVAYRLPFPSILCPPFETGPLDRLLGLAVALETRTINTNSLHITEKDLFPPTGTESLRVQADFGFVGPAGRPLVVASADQTPVGVALQPKSTATPLVLCGMRLFSASSLSVETDRQALFEALVSWAAAQRSVVSSAVPDETPANDLDPALLKSLSVLLAGAGVRSFPEIIEAADAVLGLTLTPTEINLGLRALAQEGLIRQEGETVMAHMERLEQYIQQLGLWPYVRMLRRDLARQGK